MTTVIKSNHAGRKEYCKNQALDRLGETRLNTLGSKMWIVGYTSATNIDVQFDDGFVANGIWYGNFINGAVRSPNDVSVYGHGYIGIGEHKTAIDGKKTLQYVTWTSMLGRVYSTKSKERRPEYKGCSVSEGWFNFQVFAKWYDDNFYKCDELHLDKDILFHGNKVYGPETCVFVPQLINSLFAKCKASRGLYPIGVTEANGKYCARGSIGIGAMKHIGYFTTPTEAFNAYKEFKENYIKSVAERYRDIIPEKLYVAMMKYEVLIDD